MSAFLRIIIMGLIGFAGPNLLRIFLGDLVPYTKEQVFVIQIAFMFLFAGAAAVDILKDSILLAIYGSPDDSSEEEAEDVPVTPVPTVTEVKVVYVQRESEPVGLKAISAFLLMAIAGVLLLFHFFGGVEYHMEKLWYSMRDIFLNEDIPLEILMRGPTIVTAIGFAVLVLVTGIVFMILVVISAAVIVEVSRWFIHMLRGKKSSRDEDWGSDEPSEG